MGTYGRNSLEMTSPIELLRERYHEVKRMAALALANKNEIDYAALKKLELSYYSSIELLMHDKVCLSIPRGMFDLKEHEIKDILKNCVVGIERNHKYSTTYFAKKYNVKTNVIRNLIYRRRIKPKLKKAI